MAFKISIHNGEWSDEIDLPVNKTEQDRILNLLDSVEDTQFKISPDRGLTTFVDCHHQWGIAPRPKEQLQIVVSL